MIKILLLSNGVVFLFMAVFGDFSIDGRSLNSYLTEYFALIPFGFGFLPWQLVTYQFMHAGWSHILYNLFGLWMFGMEIENIWGSKKFLIYYLVCGVVAGIFQLALAPVFEPTQLAPTVGASGAVYGVLIAFAMMFPDRYIFLYFLLPIKAKYFVGGLILLGVFAVGSPGNVANLAHLGGAFAGFLMILSDRGQIPFTRTFNNMRSRMRQQQRVWPGEDVLDAKVYDIKDGKPKDDRNETQRRVDEILDKISRSGYQNLTDEEKRILFEESKKLN
ncbi:MAG: rhomboid family intramembrane serine protease [Ignavibacteriae bacterium]|nr:rhomboid family intramembrane serine protease [Ignavibacteriota bacterium]